LESEGVSEAASSDAEANKQAARSMLEAGSTIEEIAAVTKLGRNQILGLKGSIAKANKRLESEAKASPSENLGEEEIITDFKKETQVTNSALSLARSQQRLKSLDPAKYQELHGGQQQPEGNSPSRVLVDLETAKLIRSMREETEQERHKNNGDSSSQAIAELQKEFNAFKEETHKKELEALQKQSDKLEGQISDLRADLSRSTNSNSDLAVVVKEGKDLLVKALESSGPLRSYLIPTENFLHKKEEAPTLHTQAVATPAPGEFDFLAEMKKHGLVTTVRNRGL